MADKIAVIGAGLAGSEASWQIAKRGIEVDLYDMKPLKFSPAHKDENFAELVCSNSLRSDDFMHNAVGLMHEEMRRAGSLILSIAEKTKVPSGGALAVDRKNFALEVTKALKNEPKINIIEKEIESIDDLNYPLIMIATGPLTAEKLAEDILEKVGDETLSFYDAIAPVVYKESIDFEKAWYQSRYDKGEPKDYINCPMNKLQYENFVSELLKAETVAFHKFEKPQYFDGCLPIEVMAERGLETLRFGPMKPVGLTNPHNPQERPYAVVQLRQDNKEDTLRNIVGFQTKLKYSEQEKIFRTIPGLENAQFARLGGIHKNTFIKSPILLDKYLRLRTEPHIMFAGQITGCEGYVESACVGFLAGVFASSLIKNEDPVLPPRETAFGSMLAHLQDKENIENYQPMNINFGLFPEIPPVLTKSGKYKHLKGLERKEQYCTRALKSLQGWLQQIQKH
ncbi:MAG: methylenetetrahydrofolate--tRNA-(uracil(54)-C(5))-methyltransferase (FADH(2)-oxidizing) TrmFO [Alphaproteobacteria bacterium]|nr:methylenetetrahydrofolate--tRNA-(uracil(54)-C(5))-methyltransferase (FADH(2)-oxidizing) TrmFO [Alphaproteobacteria bacterium]